MDKKTKALKLALEALLSCSVGDYSTGHVIHPSFDVDAVNKAIEAIREALAEQTPPAAPASQEEIQRLSALVRAQQITIEKLESQRQWVGLTDEEIETAMPSGIYDCLADPWDCGVGDVNEMRSIKNDVVRIARAIEAKLREKNA